MLPVYLDFQKMLCNTLGYLETRLAADEFTQMAFPFEFNFRKFRLLHRFYFKLDPCSLAVRFVLEWIGAPFDAKQPRLY